MSAAGKEIRIGISGWVYPPWRGPFYPQGLPQKRELEFASRQLNTIEINSTFYGLHRPASFRKWRDAVPEDFLFSVKGSRYVTHVRRLEDVKLPLANFFASGVLALGRKLGPLLWQLPPSLPYRRERLEAFLALLPKDTGEASALAARHDAKFEGGAVLKAEEEGPLRHALEVRHASFEQESFIELLRSHGVALVVADTAGKWPFIEDMTADFAYLRLHGDEELYASGYSDEALETWAAKIRRWSAGGTPAKARLLTSRPSPLEAGRDVFVYFDNSMKTRAPADARSLAAKLGLPPPEG